MTILWNHTVKAYNTTQHVNYFHKQLNFKFLFIKYFALWVKNLHTLIVREEQIFSLRPAGNCSLLESLYPLLIGAKVINYAALKNTLDPYRHFHILISQQLSACSGYQCVYVSSVLLYLSLSIAYVKWPLNIVAYYSASKAWYLFAHKTTGMGPRSLSVICIINAATKVKVKDIAHRINKIAQMITNNSLITHNCM